MPIVSSGVHLKYDNGVTRLLPSDLYTTGDEDSFGSKTDIGQRRLSSAEARPLGSPPAGAAGAISQRAVPQGDSQGVTTTGGSAIKCADALRAAGAEIVRVISIVDRQDGAEQAFAAAGMDFQPLLTLADLGGRGMESAKGQVRKSYGPRTQLVAVRSCAAAGHSVPH